MAIEVEISSRSDKHKNGGALLERFFTDALLERFWDSEDRALKEAMGALSSNKSACEDVA
jgi:hypothetical protein